VQPAPSVPLANFPRQPGPGRSMHACQRGRQADAQWAVLLFMGLAVKLQDAQAADAGAGSPGAAGAVEASGAWASESTKYALHALWRTFFSLVSSAAMGLLAATCTRPRSHWCCGLRKWERTLKEVGITFQVYQQLGVMGVRSRSTLMGLQEPEWQRVHDTIPDIEQVRLLENLRDKLRSRSEHEHILNHLSGYRRLEDDEVADKRQVWQFKRTVFLAVFSLCIIGMLLWNQLWEIRQRKAVAASLRRQLQELNETEARTASGVPLLGRGEYNELRNRLQQDIEAHLRDRLDHTVAGLRGPPGQRGPRGDGDLGRCRWCYACGGDYPKQVTTVDTPVSSVWTWEWGDACVGMSGSDSLPYLCCQR